MNKICTDLEQSKKLAEILPLESADMYFEPSAGFCTEPSEVRVGDIKYAHPRSIRCWSLAALLGVLPFHLITNNQIYSFNMIKGLDKNGETYAIKYAIFNTTFYLHLTDFYNNPVDACYEMILKLKDKRLI